MSDDTTQEAAPAAVEETRDARINRFASLAKEPAATPTEPENPKPQRDPETGKFLPRGEKTAPKAEPKTTAAAEPKESIADSSDPPPPTVEDEPEPAPDASPRATLSRAKELLAGGKLVEAVRAIGGEELAKELEGLTTSASKQWAAWRHQTARAEREAAAAQAKREAELEQKATKIVEQYEPLHRAQQAYDSGDFDTFVKLVTRGECETAADFSRQLIMAKHSKDPHTERLEREVRALREERERERKELEQRQQQATLAEQRQAYIDSIRDDLSASEDASVAAAASNPRFISLVFERVREHYQTHGVPLAFHDAAEKVLDEYTFVRGSGHREEPAQILDQGEPPSPVKRPRPLRRKDAAEASPPGGELSRKERIEKYVKLMRQSAPGA